MTFKPDPIDHYQDLSCRRPSKLNLIMSYFLLCVGVLYILAILFYAILVPTQPHEHDVASTLFERRYMLRQDIVRTWPCSSLP